MSVQVLLSPDPGAQNGGSQLVFPGLWRLTARNPSPMTGPGTNSYVLGVEEKIVIDPGPTDVAHFAALDRALAGIRPKAILITHPHLDHSQGAHAFARRHDTPIYAFGTCDSGRSEEMQALVQSGYEGGGEGADRAFVPDYHMRDGDELTLDEGTVRALHLPGHMGAHLGFAWDGWLFSGDHVMASTSTMISPPDGDLGQFMHATKRLLDMKWTALFPGHGDRIDNASARLQWLLEHREARHNQIRACLKRPASAREIATLLYTDIQPKLLGAATRNVFAHLLDMVWKNEALTTEKPGEETPVKLL